MKTKMKWKLLLTLILTIFAIGLPASVYAVTLFNTGILKSSNMSEEEIYGLKAKDSKKVLVEEIIELEKELQSMEDKNAMIPYLVALVEKGDEFTTDELIELIKDEQTGSGIENALVNIYISKHVEQAKLFSLLYDNGVAQETKGTIVTLGDFTVDALEDVVNNFDDSVSIIAMKRICSIDKDIAFKLGRDILDRGISKTSDEKQIAAILGVASFLELNKDYSEERNIVISQIKDIFSISSNDLVKDQAIYGLARISDYDLFSEIIYDEKIDFDLKVTAIERNIDTMIEKINGSKTFEEITTIVKAMYIHPICEVGDAIAAVVVGGRFEDGDDVQELIMYISKNGIVGAYKYEKNN